MKKPACASGRAGVAYGFDDEGHRAVLFGGQSDDGAISAESWSLDTTHVSSGSVTFNHLATKGLDPPARVDACGVVDPLGRRFFVFGGRDADGVVVAKVHKLLYVRRKDAKKPREAA